ncbi:MAG TPA: hypothetical protein VGQ34_08790, partial [Sphingomicrobium sp.]|nr:hypothetical protein [Sphingomicrobium sp.]
MAGTSRPESVSPDWLSDEEFRADLARLGSAATLKQLENWRGAGLLPAPAQRATYVEGRVSGSTVWHSPLEAHQALAIERVLANHNRLDVAGRVLWLAGATVDERHWRPGLDQAGATVLKVRRGLRLLTRETPNGEDTFGERLVPPLGELNG